MIDVLKGGKDLGASEGGRQKTSSDHEKQFSGAAEQDSVERGAFLLLAPKAESGPNLVAVLATAADIAAAVAHLHACDIVGVAVPVRSTFRLAQRQAERVPAGLANDSSRSCFCLPCLRLSSASPSGTSFAAMCVSTRVVAVSTVGPAF